ncbi:uncharacterized protein LOC111831054 [Capsella rubella]|uniref:uncharacterized protein LOC111831054 n=1 Tax=Capsella rubella TaxID=81985 RepID=UPI000CD4CDBD|nr:uncharacterized protein LOC111831054 [Capsella rubella]
MENPQQQFPSLAPTRIGVGDAPRNHTHRQDIVPPTVQIKNFEIKSGLISMVQQNKFHSLPKKDPLDHLDEFDRLCSLTKINGVSEDGFKLRLFPFSLCNKAHQWEKTLPLGSITSWDQCKQSFLAKFFSNSRTTRLRNEISGFTQKNGETLCKAWERFKSYQSQCPHHGFTKESLLRTLYRGVLSKIRMLLDTASKGSFLNKDVGDGWELVENLTQSDGNYNEDYDRTIRASTKLDEKYKKEMKAMNDKLDKLLMSQQKNIHFVSEGDSFQILDGEREQSEEISYVQNKVDTKRDTIPISRIPICLIGAPMMQIPRSGYQPLAGPPPPLGFQPQHAPPPQAPDHDMKNMLQQLLKGQFETLNSKIKYMEGKTASTSAPKPGQIPRKAVQNPKKFAHAITLRSGKNLPPKQGPFDVTEDSEDLEGEDVSSKDKSARYVPPPYKPPLPAEKYKALFEKQVKEIELRMPLLDTFVLVPPYQKFLKYLVMERAKEIQGMVILSYECSAIIQNKITSLKLKDLGSFPLSFSRCLCDLGALVSIMPLSEAKRLGFTRYKACNISLILADRSVRLPHGLLEKLPISIGVVEVPTDFVVLEMDEEPKDPLIPGRPFLATTRAIIDDHIKTALTKNESDGFLHAETKVYEILLNTYKATDDSERFKELDESVKEVCSVEEEVSGIPITHLANDDWSELKAPKVELKPLPSGVSLNNEELELLVTELRKYRRAIGYSSFSSCLLDLCRVLARCEETSLVLNWEKCHFMMNEGIV